MHSITSSSQDLRAKLLDEVSKGHDLAGRGSRFASTGTTALPVGVRALQSLNFLPLTISQGTIS